MTVGIDEPFKTLGQLLRSTQEFWQPVAFHTPSSQFSEPLGEISKKLLSLSSTQKETLHYEPSPLASMLKTQIPEMVEILTLSELPIAAKLDAASLPSVDPRFYAGIPGRKWQQVQDFSASLHISERSFLEYCAGKSHLGFYLEHCFGKEVLAVEWQKSLVQQANQRANTRGHKLLSKAINVMNSECAAYFQEPRHVVALHACGELHERMLALCVEHNIHDLSLAPCCYHKRKAECYMPYSQIGKNSQLRLSKTDLHTAVMETVTAGNTVKKKRKTLQIMRLGFDLLQRDLLCGDSFLPLPSMPLSWSRVSFEDFCRHCALQTQMSIPANINWQSYWQRALQRFEEVAAFDLLRALFRRPLELWLNMDKASWLSAHGYQVSLSTFCDRQVSPRNILLQATR